MKTLTPPQWNANLTKKYWTKNKNHTPQNTGLSDEIEDAKALFDKIKWQKFDPATFPNPAKAKGLIAELWSDQIEPVRDALGIVKTHTKLIASKYPKEKKSASTALEIYKMADQMTLTLALNSQFFSDAAHNLRELVEAENTRLGNLQEAKERYAAARRDFIAEYPKKIKPAADIAVLLRANAADAAAKLARMKSNRALAAEIFPQLGDLRRTSEAEAKKADALRDTLKNTLATQRNLTAASFGLKDRDVDEYKALTSAAYQKFEEFDILFQKIAKYRSEINNAFEEAEFLAGANASDLDVLRKQLSLDLKEIARIIEDISKVFSFGNASQIPKHLGVLDNLIKAVAEGDYTQLSSLRKTIEQFEPQGVKAMNTLTKAHAMIAKRCRAAIDSIPSHHRDDLADLKKKFDDNIGVITAFLRERTSDYAVCQQKIQKAKNLLAKVD